MREAVGGGHWHSDELAAITVPVRVVWGSRDRILPPRDATAHWRDALAEAEWIELAGLGHLLQLDDPERIARLVLEVSAPAVVPMR